MYELHKKETTLLFCSINLSKEQVMHLMAAFYLNAMTTHLPKFRIPDFDYQRFVQDVKGLFEEKEWLIVEKGERGAGTDRIK